MDTDKKNICFLNTVSQWGGGEKWHYETALYLQSKGYNVFFITAPDSALDQKLKNTAVKVFIIEIKKLSWLNPFKVNQLAGIFKTNNIHTVLINSSPDVKICGIAANKANCKRIIYRRGSAIPIKNTAINRYVFGKLLTDVLANSEATKKTINANKSDMFPEEKIRVIYNPVNTESLLKNNFEKIYHKKGNEVIIGNLARLAPQKNQIFFIDLAKRLALEKINYKILIGGTGDLEPELQKAILAAGLQENILLTGFQENAKNFIGSCDIFLLPSLWEGFGYVLAEASLCKKPVIAFNISSNPEIVINGQTGFLTALNDIDAVVEKIKWLINNPHLAAEMGNKGFEYCYNKFNPETIYNQLINYLDEQN